MGRQFAPQLAVTFPFLKHIPLTEMFSVRQSTEMVITPARCDNKIHDDFAFSVCPFLFFKFFPPLSSCKENQTNNTSTKPDSDYE